MLDCYLTVFLLGSFVFWAEATVLRRCTLTGGSPKTLLTGLSASTLLGLDSSSQTLFVLDQSVGTLRSMSYQGTGVTSLVNDPVNIDPGTFSGITIQQVEYSLHRWVGYSSCLYFPSKMMMHFASSLNPALAVLPTLLPSMAHENP